VSGCLSSISYTDASAERKQFGKVYQNGCFEGNFKDNEICDGVWYIPEDIDVYLDGYDEDDLCNVMDTFKEYRFEAGERVPGPASQTGVER
jgi:hypothetical protein